MFAQLEVPNNEPVILPITFNDPVTVKPFVKLPEPDTSKLYCGFGWLIPINPFDDPENTAEPESAYEPEPKIKAPILIRLADDSATPILVPITMLFCEPEIAQLDL